CGPGEYVQIPCIATKNTICAACPKDTFSRNYNNYTMCLDCTFYDCPQFSILKSECTPVADIVCECESGYKKSSAQGDHFSYCDCGPGEYVQIPCTATKNTICAPCPKGTFSGSYNKYSWC
ncbi:hypothetical protein LOTGIDRAFT_87271, partial [Lottia gigantea]